MLTSFNEPTAGLGFHATEKIAIITFITRNVKFNLLKWMNSGDFWKITLRGQHIAFYKEDMEKISRPESGFIAKPTQPEELCHNTTCRFLDLKKELSSFQREAEESDRVVNDFIKVEQRSP